jgi:hypothetical protein
MPEPSPSKTGAPQHLRWWRWHTGIAAAGTPNCRPASQVTASNQGILNTCMVHDGQERDGGAATPGRHHGAQVAARTPRPWLSLNNRNPGAFSPYRSSSGKSLDLGNATNCTPYGSYTLCQWSRVVQRMGTQRHITKAHTGTHRHTQALRHTGTHSHRHTHTGTQAHRQRSTRAISLIHRQG